MEGVELSGTLSALVTNAIPFIGSVHMFVFSVFMDRFGLCFHEESFLCERMVGRLPFYQNASPSFNQFRHGRYRLVIVSGPSVVTAEFS